MKHSGKARKAAFSLVLWTLVGMAALFVAGFIATIVGTLISFLSVSLVFVWIIFVLFTFYFFRDPNPRVPAAPRIIVSPAHGKVDVIDETIEPLFMGGSCKRISIFLSVMNIHVQNAPVSGRLVFYRYSIGQFLNALKTESAALNENLLLGFDASDPAGTKIGVRLIAGLIARRIVPFVNQNDDVLRGERISLIQFGSRTDLYLPLNAVVKIKLGDHVVGGETIVASFE